MRLLVAEAFYLIGEIEKYGSGLLRVEKELESYPNLSFTFDEIANGMLATFEIVIEKSSVKSSVKGSVKIIEIMRSNKSVTIAQLSARLNISHRAIEKQISNLKKKNLIERIGPVNGGYWKVFDEK
jgi:ATP-dependent DNA helicase RecG